jgi:outer membrane PBP1 activator LpoA protein
LLLPLDSPQRTQALAVRDGFMAAHLESALMRETTVNIYDTSARGATSAYLQAQLDGAEFIVGPLLRTEVDTVLEQGGFVPTLTLNWAQTETPGFGNFYQFGLAPEDEISAIVRQAVSSGHKTAVALVASDERGYRLLNTFRNEFEALGGQLLNSAGYVPDAQDVSGAIRDLLNVSRSEQRHRRLEANLGVEVGFEARRRQDIDMIFLQASPPLGRLLAPNLRFFYAGDVPTYATAEIYEPTSRAADTDLEGVVFPDVPLLLSPDARSTALTQALQVHWPQRATQWLRLYGLGFDAYVLVAALFAVDATAWPVDGFSGTLELDAFGKIRRGLPFAQFRNGRPAMLQSPAAALSSQ